MTRDPDEFATKLKRLRFYAETAKFDGVLLSRVANFRWLSGGAVNEVGLRGERGGCAFCVTADKVILLTNTIEQPRLTDELAGLSYEVATFPWYDTLDAAVARLGGRYVSDSPVATATPRPDELRRLRTPLTNPEIMRYRMLGQSTACVVESVLAGSEPAMTGKQIAARVDGALLEAGLTPLVTLVGADDPDLRYRHPMPTDKPIHSSAMFITCAQQDGLIIALTRTVSFAPLSERAQEQQEKVGRLHTAMLSFTRPGREVSAVFADIVQAYALEGYPGEWERHHQGGAVGYETRDFVANMHSQEQVCDAQAYAWNPTIPGFKSEDTFLVTAKGAECLSDSGGAWPRQSYRVGDITTTQAGILVLS